MNGQDPAFPLDPQTVEATAFGGSQIGLTKREWFAGQALSGMLASVFGDRNAFDTLGRQAAAQNRTTGGLLAKLAYEVADAMVEDRS